MNNMDNTDANTATVSSTDAATDGMTSVGGGGNTGTTPVPHDEVKRRSLLDVVRSAVSRRISDTGSSSVERDNGSDRSTSSNDSYGERTSGGEDNVPFHNHPRWKEIMAERDALKQRAKHYDEISEYMRANGLTNAELAQGFEVMALMKNDPIKAKDVLVSHIDRISEFTGDILPRDIQYKLDIGEIDEDSAKELAKYRAKNEYTSRAVAENQANQIAQQEQMHQKMMYDAVVNWEGLIASRDPEYRNKQALVTDRVKSIMQESGRPGNPEQAVQYVERAYNEINQRLGSLAGRTVPTRNPMSTNSSSSGSFAPQPRSLKEAISWAAKRGGPSR